MHVAMWLLQAVPPAGAVPPDQIVVANRGASSLSVIDVATDQVVKTVVMPDGGEPTYLSHASEGNRLFVADRANDRVVVFHADDFTVETTIPAGRGVFHCWLDPLESQAWITNDIDSTVTVIDTLLLDVITTIAMPADLVGQGYVPHDVNLGLAVDSHDAFVTMTAPALPGYVVKYDTQTFTEVTRLEVGGDPHVSLPSFAPRLVVVMSQVAGEVAVATRRSLTPIIDPLVVPGAHGGVMNRDYVGSHFYTTNLPAGGVGGIVTIDPITMAVVAETDTPHATPHNMALADGGRKLYVTHSGATADQVSVFDLDSLTGIPTYSGEVIVGLNPFGIAPLPDDISGVADDDSSSDGDGWDDDSSSDGDDAYCDD